MLEVLKVATNTASQKHKFDIKYTVYKSKVNLSMIILYSFHQEAYTVEKKFRFPHAS